MTYYNIIIHYHCTTGTKIKKMDNRTKRRLKEMEKIKKTGTSTEFDVGYYQALKETKLPKFMNLFRKRNRCILFVCPSKVKLIREIKDMLEDFEIEKSIKQTGSYIGMYRGSYVNIDGMRVIKNNNENT